MQSIQRVLSPSNLGHWPRSRASPLGLRRATGSRTKTATFLQPKRPNPGKHGQEALRAQRETGLHAVSSSDTGITQMTQKQVCPPLPPGPASAASSISVCLLVKVSRTPAEPWAGTRGLGMGPEPQARAGPLAQEGFSPFKRWTSPQRAGHRRAEPHTAGTGLECDVFLNPVRDTWTGQPDTLADGRVRGCPSPLSLRSGPRRRPRPTVLSASCACQWERGAVTGAWHPGRQESLGCSGRHCGPCCPLLPGPERRGRSASSRDGRLPEPTTGSPS